MRLANRSELSPITIVKTLDHISPMLQESLQQNHMMTVLIRIFGQDPDDGGRVETHNLTLQQARISGIRVELPTGSPGTIPRPLERVSFLPATFVHESVLGQGFESTWNWENQ